MKLPTNNPQLIGATLQLKYKFKLLFKAKLRLIIIGLYICPKLVIKRRWYEKLVEDLTENTDKYFLLTKNTSP